MTKVASLIEATKEHINLQSAHQIEAFTVSFYRHYTIMKSKGFFSAWNCSGKYFGTYDSLEQLKKDISKKED